MAKSKTEPTPEPKAAPDPEVDPAPEAIQEPSVEGWSEPASEPETDPEHGDLTPAFARWYLDTKSAAEFIAKYGGRIDQLPADLVARLHEGRIV